MLTALTAPTATITLLRLKDRIQELLDKRPKDEVAEARRTLNSIDTLRRNAAEAQRKLEEAEAELGL